MLKKSRGTYWFPNDVYPAYIGFVPDEKAWDAAMRHLSVRDPKPYPKAGARCSSFENEKTGDMCVLIAVSQRITDPVAIVGSMAHEAVHCWEYVRDWIGEKDPGSEQVAYFVEFVVRNLLEAFAASGRVADK